MSLPNVSDTLLVKMEQNSWTYVAESWTTTRWTKGSGIRCTAQCYSQAIDHRSCIKVQVPSVSHCGLQLYPIGILTGLGPFSWSGITLRIEVQVLTPRHHIFQTQREIWGLKKFNRRYLSTWTTSKHCRRGIDTSTCTVHTENLCVQFNSCGNEMKSCVAKLKMVEFHAWIKHEQGWFSQNINFLILPSRWHQLLLYTL